jgi:anti-anti-sigma factor
MTILASHKSHRIDLTLGRSRVLVELGGEIDLLAAPDLRQLLGSLHRLHSDVCLDLAAVSFMDTAGLEPLIEATRDRRDLKLPPLSLRNCSGPVLRLLDVVGIDSDTILDTDRWDRLAESPQQFARLSADGIAGA